MARDPDRIPELATLLEELWSLFPDQRLSQLVLNACRHAAGPSWPNVWAVEDGDLREGLERLRQQALHRGRSWILWRQDDHGNRFVVDRFDAPGEAEGARKQFTARGHKQLYWVEERASPEQDAESPS